MKLLLNVMMLVSLVTSGVQGAEKNRGEFTFPKISPAESVISLDQISLASANGRGSLPVAQWKQLQEAVSANGQEGYCEDENQYTQFGALMACISRHQEQINISIKEKDENIQGLIGKVSLLEKRPTTEQLDEVKEQLLKARGTWTGFFTRYGLVGVGCFGLGWAAKSGALSSLAQKIGIPGFSE